MKWSYTAHNVMRRCQREFAFNQIIASPTAKDAERHEAYVLKQLQPRSAWLGSLVHRVLSTIFLADLRAGQSIDQAKLTTAAQALARRQFTFSAAKQYRVVGQTKGKAKNDYCALFEHEHDLDISQDVLAVLDGKLASCFDHLAGQGEFLASLYAGKQYLAELPLNFKLNGASITATLDLVFLRANGQPTIVDWKIAESETSDYSRQLFIYALAVLRSGRWPAARAEEMELYEANLLKNVVRRHELSTERLAEAEDFIYRSLVERDALFGKGSFKDLDLDALEVAEQPTTCAYCNFRSLCIRKLEATDRAAEAAVVQGRLWQDL